MAKIDELIDQLQKTASAEETLVKSLHEHSAGEPAPVEPVEPVSQEKTAEEATPVTVVEVSEENMYKLAELADNMGRIKARAFMDELSNLLGEPNEKTASVNYNEQEVAIIEQIMNNIFGGK